ncbi:MAG TPA: nicotinamide riboside transporter PnuC [Chitinophagaceae bacterium]
MSFQEIWQHFLLNIRETRWQEWVSTVTQLASVVYARKNNILVYPTGIIGVLLAAWVYFFQTHPPLYADASLNLYYFAMSVYGWYNWVQKKDATHHVFPISWCNAKELRTGILMFLVSWIVIYIVLDRFTNSNTPVLDSLVSASAITAMWWMAKRKIENWLAWTASNLVAIPLNFYKELMLFTLMYVVFLVLAWMGFRSWKKMAEQPEGA